MRKRNMGYQDYGFDVGEEYKLKEYCKIADQLDQSDLLQSAYCANPYIAHELWYTLITGLSYDKLASIHYIPISKTDFYAYQRACLAQFKDILIQKGKWGK